MLIQYNPLDVEIALHQAEPRWPPFPPGSDRAAWNAVRARLGQDAVDRAIRNAEEAAQEPIPFLPATLYLEFKRNGRREGYENPRFQRSLLLSQLVVAECLEYKGRFLDAILNLAWAICEESSWAYPAHQSDLTDIGRPYIDLGAATTGLELAELDALLGDALDPLLGKRIHDEVDRRLLTPYLERHDFWWLHNTRLRTVNNWTAVCNAGVVGAACYLEKDPARLAEIMARAARSLDDYLVTFDADGGSTEGPGYWGYGFGHYVILAQLVEARSGGLIDFFAPEIVRKVARFPAAMTMSPGRYVNFSDCDAEVILERSLLAFLAGRLDLPELAGLAQTQPADSARDVLQWEIRKLFWQLPADAPAFAPSAHEWYAGMMWMIARYDPADPNGLVLAAKGGHNDEMHNQNDVGNFIVHFKQESVIPDVGRGRYTKAYFGPERYEHFVNSSLGHSVPVPNGALQIPGAHAAALLVDHRADETADTLIVELAGAYPPEAALESLQRRVTLHREAPHGWVEVEDRFRFADQPAPFESALTVFGRVEEGFDALVIHGDRGNLRVGYDAETVEARVDLHTEIDMPYGPRDVRRIVFTVREPAQEGAVRLEIEPVGT
ncbi:MAG: heparinase II/III family protein [Caldilineaceae bacterium]|nr:heparinase II/III family protein [Caldilineaceae bacterium]